jgi:hypothetical protein
MLIQYGASHGIDLAEPGFGSGRLQNILKCAATTANVLDIPFGLVNTMNLLTFVPNFERFDIVGGLTLLVKMTHASFDV